MARRSYHDFSVPKDNTPGKLTPKQLQSVEDIVAFMFAGNATLTLVSKKSGTRFTFRIKRAPEEMPDGSPSIVSHFVALMNGPDNESDYQYLGHYYKRSGDYSHGAKSKITEAAPSAKVFRWFQDTVVLGHKLHSELEVWHEGRCGMCNRKLTVPESIDRGIGPECWKRFPNIKQQEMVV